ncbi:unnamed protein product, partial [Effrenium voratum]
EGVKLPAGVEQELRECMKLQKNAAKTAAAASAPRPAVEPPPHWRPSSAKTATVLTTPTVQTEARSILRLAKITSQLESHYG